ncbi:GspH/FimT family pseudopilin [Serpentinimonas maccroryi]|uniref:GspH/FimT family pseudopilin n=1 Tax=Serpentinimonas maccroryi TaxID=1458426 RepID=UPI0020349463|nr:GspH/FimT family pseudopilin [Serpentinimonas maccroryi]MCM2477976.1 prepilin-type N-terminal cleavage/methylation domain-containing protein [Serpentinimonas maccroryi]
MSTLARLRRRVRGVTLIEVMVVVGIVAILAMMAAPNFRAMIERNQINSATNELMMGLQLARSEAIRLNSTVTLCRRAVPINPNDAPSCANPLDNPQGWQNGWIVFHDRDGDGSVTPAQAGPPAVAADAVLRTWGALGPRLTLRGSADVAQRVSYNALGQAQLAITNSHHLIVCHNNQLLQARAIVVTRTRPRLSTDSNADRIPENDAGVNFATCTP